MEFPKQFDNISTHVIDDLKITLRKGSKVSMAAASLSIYALHYFIPMISRRGAWVLLTFIEYL